MRSVLSLVLVFTVLARFPSGIHAQPAPEFILRGKRATARIETKSGKQVGTAFCIAETGFFLTGARGIENIAANDPLVLAVSPGETTQQRIVATVIRIDKEADIALLKTEGKGLTALEFGESDGLIETAAVTTFGYSLAPDSAALTVHVGRISGLNKIGGVLNRVQIEMPFASGISGGPVMDGKGRVVGMIASQAGNSSLTLTVPASRIAFFLSKPEILFDPAPIPSAKQSEPYEFRFQLVSLLKPRKNLTMAFTLTEPGQPPRQVAAQLIGKDNYVAKIIPVLPQKSPRRVQLTLAAEPTPTVFQIQDRNISVSKETVKLSTVSRIETKAGITTLTLSNGRQLTGQIQGLEAVQTRIGEVPVTLDLSHPASLVIEDADPSPGFTAYTIAVKQGDQVLETREGTLLIEGAAGSPTRGMLLVCADEIPTLLDRLPNGQINSETDVKRYVLNVARLFMGGKRGKFLIYSDGAMFGKPFQEILRQAGHTVVQDARVSSLEGYDAVFTGGSLYVNRELLAPYVQRGGKVYLAGGCGDEGPYWARLLRPFGMSFGRDTYVHPPDPAPVVATNFGSQSLFRGVKSLLIAGISPIQLSPGNFPNTKVLVHQENFNLWAMYVSDPIVPPTPKTTLPDGTVLGNPVFSQITGHWYRSVTVPDDITWTEAKRAAERMNYQGWRGHLVTVTSEEENRFFASTFAEMMAAGCWMGGFQDKQASDYREPDGGWRWVTGEKWNYSHWNHGLYQEPNDGLGGHEDWLGFTGDGRWNDLPDVRTDRMHCFVVEFEK